MRAERFALVVDLPSIPREWHRNETKLHDTASYPILPILVRLAGNRTHTNERNPSTTEESRLPQHARPD